MSSPCWQCGYRVPSCKREIRQEYKKKSTHNEDKKFSGTRHSCYQTHKHRFPFEPYHHLSVKMYVACETNNRNILPHSLSLIVSGVAGAVKQWLQLDLTWLHLTREHTANGCSFYDSKRARHFLLSFQIYYIEHMHTHTNCVRLYDVRSMVVDRSRSNEIYRAVPHNLLLLDSVHVFFVHSDR